MAQQEIDIGVEGNDGTGDSIRESFKKVNENFSEVYAVFGLGGQIGFTDLGDTPNSYIGNEDKIPVVNSINNSLEFREFASNSSLDGTADSIGFDFTVNGKIIVRQLSNRVSLDLEPQLGGPLNAASNGIANIDISQSAIDVFNGIHGTNLTIDDLVINKRYGDSNYQKRITIGGGLRLDSEPTSRSRYTKTIESFSTLAGAAGGNIIITNHGFTDDYNGAAFVLTSTGSMPSAVLLTGGTVTLVDGDVYYVRVVDNNILSLFGNEIDALLGQNKLFLSGGSGIIQLVDRDFDESLEGNWLSSVPLPRESVVRREGDTMTGPLTLNDHPGILKGSGTPNGLDDLQAVSKLYVDSLSNESQVNLYVSTFGDDKQLSTPFGSEGRSTAYAFKTLNAASRKAEEIMISSPFEAGPYRQTITFAGGAESSTVITAGIDNPISNRSFAVNAIEANFNFLKSEVVAFVNDAFSDFSYDEELLKRDIELILKSINLDVVRGDNANYLSRWAGLRYYGSVSGRRTIGQQKQQTKAAINYLKSLVVNYILTDTTIPTTYQTRFSQVSIDVSSMDNAAIGAISPKFDQIVNIIENGVFSADPVRDGSRQYRINLTNGNLGSVDQAQTGNVDIIPGKVIVGKSSGAIGRIINYVTGDDGSEVFDYVFVDLLEPIEFENGEQLEYGNIVKETQITIRVESGIYEEDFPIRVPENVSIKGDEFRRCLIRPKNRTSQSPLSNIFFYRDNKFDGMVIGRSEISTIGSFVNVDANPNRTGAAGVYTITDSQYTSTGIGSAAEFEVTVAADGSITLTVESTGKDFAPGDTITIPDSEIGASGEDSINFQILTVPNGVAYTNSLTGIVDGHFGRHYLENPGLTRNTGPGLTNLGNWTIQGKILNDNKEFIKEQVNEYLKDTYPAIVGQYNVQKFEDKIGKTVDALILDLRVGGLENSLEIQGTWYESRSIYDAVITEILDSLDYLSTLCNELLLGTVTTIYGSNLTYSQPDLFYGDSTPVLWEEEKVYNKNDVVRYLDGLTFSFIRSAIRHTSGATLDSTEISNYWNSIDSPNVTIENLISLVVFAFDSNYNPPKNNRNIDVFLMNDGTILRNITVQGQGGFMSILDPEGQILTRSPYIQTGSSFSQSVNKQSFRGGLFVDAFCGNSAARVTGKSTPFILTVSSPAGQGLFIRRPQTPCAFYIDGRRFQVNAVTNYDPALGTATIILDPTSNSGTGFSGTTSLIVGEGVDLDDLTTPIDITLQTAGNRSMLGNDFTQINDLGYGLVCVNGGISEMVSMFTYYCWASYYSKNGSEIRSLTGSSCYGEYGLVAEGADPNEVPDRIVLAEDMVEVAKSFAADFILELSDVLSVIVGDVIEQPNTNASGIVSVSTNSHYVYLTNITNFFNTTDPLQFSTGTPITQTIVDIDTTNYINSRELLSLFSYDFKTPPAARSELNIFHPGVGRFERYIVTNVTAINSHVVGSTTGINDNKSVKSSPSVGSGAVFDIFKTTDSGYDVKITVGGTGYTIGGVFVVAGDILGGIDTTNDATVTITEIDSGELNGAGVITGVSISGTAVYDDITPVYSGIIYKLNFSTTAGSGNEGAFGANGLVEAVDLGRYIDYRRNSVFILSDVTDIETLNIRPSTAIIFDENPNIVYRSISFQSSDGVGNLLEEDQTAAGFDSVYDYIRLIVNNTKSTENIGLTLDLDGNPLTSGTTKGHTAGDLVIAVDAVLDDNEIYRLNNNARTPANNRPLNWSTDTLVEAPIFTWHGKKFYVFNYRTIQRISNQDQIVLPAQYQSSSNIYAVVDILDVGESVNRDYTGVGLPQTLNIQGQQTTLRAGLKSGALGDVTINISTCRATGHDFLDVGTGGFNTTNYPNVIYGNPRNPQQSNEIVETGKGRVFYVSTDQNGVFRVGKFFSVDQGTGSVSFEASIALSNVDGLGFKRGVVITEFSTDSGMTDNATDSVPTESAVRGYVDRRLGFDQNGILVTNPLGPSVLTANGAVPLSANLNAAQNKIVNLKFPEADSDAVNKLYVDRSMNLSDTLERLRDTTFSSVEESDLLIASGLKRFVLDGNTIVNGLFVVGEIISGDLSGATGIIRDLYALPSIDENLLNIVYEKTSSADFSSGGILGADTVTASNGAEGVIIDGPSDEWMNGKLDIDSDIEITTTRDLTVSNGAITSRSLTVDIQIKPSTIRNADIAADAEIVQSKLTLNSAGTRVDATGITQNDLGLSSYNQIEFDSTNGFIEIKTATSDQNGVSLDKLSWIGNHKVLARNDTASTPAPFGVVSDVNFSDVVNIGGGILHTDIPDADLGVVIRTGAETYDILGVTTIGESDRLVRTTATGGVHARELVVGLESTYKILSVNGTDIVFTTPGQGRILTARGTTGDVNIRVGGNVDIIGDGGVGNDKTSDSVLKTNSTSYFDSKALAVEWMYTNFIEAANEKNAVSSGISIGAGSGFSNTNQVAIVVGDTIANNSKTPFIFSSTGVIPDVDAATDIDGYNIGDNARRYNSIFARNISLENAIINGNLTVNGNTILGSDTSDTVTIKAPITAESTLTAGNTNVGTLGVNGAATLQSDLTVDGNTILGNAPSTTTRVKGNLTAEQALDVQGTLTTRNIVPDANNIRTIGTASNRYNTVYASFFDGIATKAYYADLAENYTADAHYEPGTVLVFGGEEEVTLTTTHNDHRVAGIVSTNPAYLMNSHQEGNNVTMIALQGRVPCKVIGRAQKGDILVTSAISGYAIVNNDAHAGRIIGKALENKADSGKGIIEVVVGKH